VADPGADRRYHRRIDVWTLRKLPLCHRDEARRTRGTVLTKNGKAATCSQVKIRFTKSGQSTKTSEGPNQLYTRTRNT
jgi:hypothetical protein